MHGAIPVIAACIRTGVLTIFSRVIPTGGSMQTLIGSPALSEFKTQRLLSALTKENPEITGVSAFYCHFIDLAEDLTDEQKNQLERLLTYGPRMHLTLVVQSHGYRSHLWTYKDQTHRAWDCLLPSRRPVDRQPQGTHP